MNDDEERLSAAKNLVRRVLSLQITRQGDPSVFNDDTLYLGVRLIEHRDPAWLLTQVSDASSTVDGKNELALVMSSDLRAKAGLYSPNSHLFS